MTRDEFLSRLGELLSCLPAEQVEETKQFYAEAIADRMEEGMSEEEAVAAMGAPGRLPRPRSTTCPPCHAPSRGRGAEAPSFCGCSPSWGRRCGCRC